MPNESIVLALMVGLGILAAFTLGAGVGAIVDWALSSFFGKVLTDD